MQSILILKSAKKKDPVSTMQKTDWAVMRYNHWGTSFQRDLPLIRDICWVHLPREIYPGYISPWYISRGYISPGYISPGPISRGYISSFKSQITNQMRSNDQMRSNAIK